MGRPTAGVLLALVALAGSPTSQAQPFKGRCEDSVVLGSERWPELKRAFAEQRELLKKGRLDEAIALQRRIAELQCHNHFQRYYLAELLVQAERPAEAVEVLGGLYDLEVNDLEKRLAAEGNALHPLLASDAFAGSELARRLAAKRAEHTARRARFEKKLAALAADERPPNPYVAQGACPFECCSYRRWSVLEDTSLVAAPGSDRVVGMAAAGGHVEGLTGEVHVVPIPVAVVHAAPAYGPQSTIAAGAIVFLLDHIGEGMGHVWHRGRVHEMATSGEVQAHCPFPAEDCWGELLAESDPERDHVWWVQVRLPDGTTGWTREIHFGDIDACG